MRLIFISLFLINTSLVAQSINNWQETPFAFKVKQVDEFIDRFNHSNQTLAIQQNPNLTHQENLLSLFDQENETWDYPLIEKFVKEVSNRSGQSILDFYDPDWYAALDCTFSLQGSMRKLTLILQNQLARNGGSKWVIVSVLEGLDGIYCEDIPKAKSEHHYLHPMSHSSNFMELESAFEDTENLQNFFDTWNQGMDFLAFKHSIRNGSLKFVEIHGITYHFLQLENWLFTLNYFPRKEPNSGWLISSLSTASEVDKKRYKAQKLNLL